MNRMNIDANCGSVPSKCNERQEAGGDQFGLGGRK